MESFIEDKTNLYRSILEFLEGSDEDNGEEISSESFEKIIEII